MKKLLTLALTLASFNAFSTYYAGGVIKTVTLGKAYENKAFFWVEGSPSKKAECQDNKSANFALDISTETGKATYSLILAAQMSGTKVNVSGTGSCDIYGGIEDLNWVTAVK